MTGVDVEVSSVVVLAPEGDAVLVVGEDVAEAVQPEVGRQLPDFPVINRDFTTHSLDFEPS